ncbi:hypothetical protein [Streptomyces sp. NPDC046988]|uniref:hypothetical protein n=1 Tax=Streptomyces sp. NPDC046988 TaxID=3154922 RepID=UPI0033CB8ED5
MILRRRSRRAGDDSTSGPTAGGTAERSARKAPRTTKDAEGPARPTDVQVWNWAESAVLGGYGPSASSFL